MENILITDRLKNLSTELPCGRMRGVSIGRKRYILVHTKNDKWFLVNEECPHSGAKLTGGSLTDQHELICPMHAYSFNLYDGAEERGRCQSLWTVKLEANGEELWWINAIH